MPIKFEDVEYVYDPNTPFENKALNAINLEIKEGEFLTVLGKTGSGKSTLVQLMNGIIKPSNGKVTVDGMATDEKGESIFDVRRKVGIVFQYPEHQFFEENVVKEISFGPTNFGFEEERVKELVMRAVEMVGLPMESLYKSPFSLSGGEKRKVAIASVIACDPKYLVFDEPTSGLDPISVERFSSLVKKFHSLGKSIIIVTHSVEFALKNSDRIIVLANGNIVFQLLKDDFRKLFELEEMENYDLLLPDVYKMARTVLRMNFSDERMKKALSFLKSILSINNQS